MSELYDVLIMTTAKDFLRVKSNYPRLVKNMPGRKLLFVGSDEVGKLVAESGLGEKVGFINENDVLPFDDVHAVMKELMGNDELPRGITGWYYQQFLKMQYATICKDEYYLVWDGDTVPCKPFSMFQEGTGIPYLDYKQEYHEEYFVTLSKLFPGMWKVIKQSFISEHMLMNCNIMNQLIDDIMKNENLAGATFFERILRVIDKEKLDDNSFSEFETYGTYVALRHLNAYRLREWHSFRYGSSYFNPDTISDSDYEWLAKDFFAISFEKGHTVREDHKDIFTKKEYQQKLSARKILEVVQETFEEGYFEIWEDSKTQVNGVQEEYLTYETLGDNLVEKNVNQAYLCYENAEFLCKNEAEKVRLRDKKEKFQKNENVKVKKVSFVIVSYNNEYLMQKCVESIQMYCPKDSYQLVVVDNASTDGVRKWLEEQKDITLLASNQNLGFPVGCNVGIQCSEPENDIFLLNNDARMAPNALFWLRMGLYENEQIGATGCVSNYCGNEQRIEVEFKLPQDYLDYGATRNVYMDYPYEERNRLCGFAMLIKREVIDTVAGFDAHFTPGYFDDDDLCVRIRRAGYRLLICHNSFIYHAGSQSFKDRNDYEEIFVRNYYYFKEKWGYDIFAYSTINKEAIAQIKANRFDKLCILEIGAGTGSTLAHIQFLYPNAEVHGIEACETVAYDGAESIPFYVGDYKKMELPFEKESFDYIICTKRNKKDSFERVEEIFTPYLKVSGRILMAVE